MLCPGQVDGNGNLRWIDLPGCAQMPAADLLASQTAIGRVMHEGSFKIHSKIIMARDDGVYFAEKQDTNSMNFYKSIANQRLFFSATDGKHVNFSVIIPLSTIAVASW
jgi:hypothetical protein